MGQTPTADEQLLLQYINRARENPLAEMDRWFNTSDADINNAVNYFGSSESVAKAQVAGLQSLAPVAWNTNLAKSADTHNNLMVQYDQQSHNLPGEPTLLNRIKDSGFDFSGGGGAGENVYAYSRSVDHAHAGFYIDWGTGPDGIQNPAGHRNVILSSSYSMVGIAARTVPGANTIGPLSVTQHFADGPAEGGPFILGVAIDDRDNDNFYDVGEGLAGVTVTATGAGGTFETTTWTSGGYSLEVAPGSSYTVTFSGNGIDQVSSVSVNQNNVSLDAETSATPSGGSGGNSGSGTGTTPSTGTGTGTGNTGSTNTTAPTLANDNLRGSARADNIQALGGDDNIKAGAGADTIDGGTGDDRLIGGNGNDSLIGGPGADWIGGQKGSDYLQGDGGSDTIRGAGGNDTIDGGAGSDYLRGHAGRDQIFGGGGHDFVYGDVDNDTLFGDGGNDRLKGGFGNDMLVGGAGRDIFHVEHGGSKTDGDVDRIADFLFDVDVLLIEAFAGLELTRIESRADLQNLNSPDITVTQAGNNVKIVFDEGPYSHTVFLENTDLFL